MTTRDAKVDEVERPPLAPVVDASEVHAYLQERGYTVDGVSVAKSGRITLYDAKDMTGIRAALAEYQGRTRDHRGQLNDLVVAIEAIPERNRSLAEQAIILLVQWLG